MNPEGNDGAGYPDLILSRAPVRINDIGGWTDTWFAGHGRVLNLAAAPGVETRIRVSNNPEHRKRRVHMHARDFGETFEVDPEAPDLARHPLLQAAVASVPIPEPVRVDESEPASVILRHPGRPILVTRDSRPVGIVTSVDVDRMIAMHHLTTEIHPAAA